LLVAGLSICVIIFIIPGNESGSQEARKGTLRKSGTQEDVCGVTYDTISCLPAFLSIFLASWLPDSLSPVTTYERIVQKADLL
jgi:hypothetical protein